MGELDKLIEENCVMNVEGGTENTYGKVNILLQSYVSRVFIDSFSLTSDMAYVAQVTWKFTCNSTREPLAQAFCSLLNLTSKL